MTFRPDLSERALSQLGGFPDAAFDELVAVVARVCEDPYDPLITRGTDDPQVRRADFGDRGFVTFLILDDVGVVRVVDITWVG